MIWAVIAVLLVALLFCGHKIVVNHREARRLHDQIEAFLNGEILSPTFSVRDDQFSMFENAVVELETRLIQSEENAKAEREKSRAFAQDISHQLKTPIAGLRLFCEVDESEHKLQKLQLIERMEALTASLLKLEKLSADGYAFEFSMCWLNELTQDVCAQFREMYPRKKISVTGDAYIRCDAQWMFEAINNLVKNACEHTAEDGCVMVVIEPSESETMIRVEDDGGGVQPEALGRLFQRFYRSGDSSSGQGVGLGLAIAKSIVQKHHGSIAAKNGEGGLQMTIYLPTFHLNLKKT